MNRDELLRFTYSEAIAELVESCGRLEREAAPDSRQGFGIVSQSTVDSLSAVARRFVLLHDALALLDGADELAAEAGKNGLRDSSQFKAVAGAVEQFVTQNVKNASRQYDPNLDLIQRTN